MPEHTALHPLVGWAAGFHLAALWAFAFVQPLFELLGNQAEFFVARGNTGGDILVFALVFTLLAPAALALAVWIVSRINHRLGLGLLVTMIGALVAAVALPPLGDMLGGSALSLVPAVLLGTVAAAAYTRVSGFRSFLTVLSPAPLLFLVLFLVGTPVSRIVFPSDDRPAVADAGPSRTPVVMLFFDELPATTLMDARGQIDARRFPAFAAFAEHATWYRNATTVAASTTEAIPALMTGERPEQGLLPTSADHPYSIFTLLARSHHLEVVEPVTDVCPRDLCSEVRPDMATRLRDLAADLRVVSAYLLLPEELRRDLPSISRAWEGFGEEVVGAEPAGITDAQRAVARAQVLQQLGQDDPAVRIRQILAAVKPVRSRPPLLFLHSTLPHGPWRFLPDGSQYVSERGAFPGLVEERWGSEQWLADQGLQRHILQTEYADRLLGQVLERLRSEGLYDSALIVIAADHGVSFRAGQPRREPTSENFQDIAGVPLLIKAPGQREGEVKENAVRTIDVLPTVADKLGVEIPWDLDGVSADRRGASEDTQIEVARSLGPPVTASFGQFLRQREARRRYEESLLRPAADDVFAMGPRPEIVGRRVEEIGAVPPGSGRVQFDASGAFAAVRLHSGILPTFVSGSVYGLASGTEIAIAVNGRVETTTRVQGSGRTAQYTALVRPQSFHAGANSLAVFELVGSRLRPLGRVAREVPYRFVQNGSGILMHGKEQIPVIPGATAGYLDFANVEDRVVMLNGWAATGDKKAPAERVVAIAGTRSLSAERPSVIREDLRKFGRRTRTAGFQLALPTEAIAAGRLRVFAIADGRASELLPVGNVSSVLESLTG